MNQETRLLDKLEDFKPKALELWYPAALAPRIEADPGVPWAVSVPDLPGCIAEGATQEEVMTNAVEAVEVWLARAKAAPGGAAAPPPTLMDTWARHADYAGWTWFFVGTKRLTEADKDLVEAVLEAPVPLAPVGAPVVAAPSPVEEAMPAEVAAPAGANAPQATGPALPAL